MNYKNLSTQQKQLYQNLMICCSNEAFYFQDFVADDVNETLYRIFNYRQASYTDFCLPGALECRGIMFEISDAGEVLRLVSRPMAKFFNAMECPFSDINSIFSDPGSNISEVDDKADGSLISSYINYCGELKLKTKGSPKSDQAIAAMYWLNCRDELLLEFTEITQNAFTINCEWCAPDNRIVLPYETGHLQVLNIRDNDSGEYLSRADIIAQAPEIAKHLVQDKVLPKGPNGTWEETLQLVRAETGIEGYVIKFNNNLWVKIKTDAYKALHWSKDSINTPRRLFEACVLETVDDLKDMFSTDTLAIAQINKMEDFVRPIYNGICDRVEDFVDKNKHLDRKDFAIKAQQELDKTLGEFHLAMKLYSGKDVSYKENLLDKWKILGLSDETKSTL